MESIVDIVDGENIYTVKKDFSIPDVELMEEYNDGEGQSIALPYPCTEEILFKFRTTGNLPTLTYTEEMC